MCRNICRRQEIVQKLDKLEKKLNEIGDFNGINISQQSYFLYDMSNLLKETFKSQLYKEMSIYNTISYFEESKENNQTNLITSNNKLKFNVRRKLIRTY